MNKHSVERIEHWPEIDLPGELVDVESIGQQQPYLFPQATSRAAADRLRLMADQVVDDELEL